MLRAGLIGFPSSGKTALFQLLTSAREAPRGAGRQEANVGVSRVPDERLDRLTALFNPKKHVPATVEFADMGGTAAGKSGAAALLDVAAFRNADALLHVVRMFRDPSVPHAAGSIDPARDVRTMEDELILADLGVVERRLERLERDMKKGATAELRKEQEILQRCRLSLEEGRPLRDLELPADDARRLRGFQFLSGKPLLLVLNLDEADLPQADRAIAIAGLQDVVKGANTRAVPICAKIELEIAQLDPADAGAFMADLGLKESGLDRVIRASYDLLGYISFFTVGEDENRAWSIPRGTNAQTAAGEIHTDIQRGFIRAEVVRYEHLLARGTLAACRDHGELRLEGKEYVVLDGDVINFRHAT
ncbi:MAG TPA: redox-regulated ATPase YchF [Vicinamibacterales bacterium]|nr:redox-regulated ATPase YchF [Vicinamibacterales bacterium]